MNEARLPAVMKFFVGFFAFGTVMCLLTTVLLACPGTFLDPLWRLNPQAHVAFQSFGRAAFVLMAAVGSACLLAAVGLARQKTWGRWLAISILMVNLVGDSANAVLRHDLRTLIGLPIAGLMIAYLLVRQNRKSERPGTK